MGYLRSIINYAGSQFGSNYRRQMISTHMAAFKLAQNYVANPSANGQIKQVAQSFIPVFQTHLAEAKKLPKQ